MTSWMLKHPKLRNDKLRRDKTGTAKEPVDINKDPTQVMKEVCYGICNDGNEDKLRYLTAFVDFHKKIDGNLDSTGYHIAEVLLCLKVSLVHTAPHIRSGGLRAVRHALVKGEDVIEFNKLLIPYLVSRSLDLTLKNDTERIEAMKLIRKVLLLNPLIFHSSLARCLISLANGGIEEKDRMLRLCLATLCELAILNSDLFIQVGGVSAVTRNLLECQMPKIVECLCGVLLFLLDKPNTRDVAGVDLFAIATPYCDFHYKHGWKDKNRDERVLRFNSSRLAMLSILRSWPGILHVCNPHNRSGLKAIVDILYLNQLHVRKAVLDLLYELLRLPQPEWTDELSVALSAVDPSEPQTSWRLNEGFVVAEGQSVLPHLAKATPKIVDMHLAVLLYCFHNNGLTDALVEVIASSDTFISVRATVLLGELLRLIQVILPPECCNTSPALPTLLEYATKNMPQAISAVSALVQFHELLKKKPVSCSLFLDYLLKSGNSMRLSMKKNRLIRYKRSRSITAKIQRFVSNTGNDMIKETGVLTHTDHLQWNWNLIRIIAKGESDLKVSMTENSHKTFFKRLIDFYLPSNNKYSHMDLKSIKICLAYTVVGIELVQFLINTNDQECVRLITVLYKDILSHVNALISGKSVHDCLFSPQHMINTQCQSYFLFIGRLATNETGLNILNQINMFQSLQKLTTTTNNDCYVKLIISSMDYNGNPLCVNLLSSVLKCNIESSRLYATQFLLILLRSGVQNFASWGVPLLVNQLSDPAKVISLSALSILHEACEITECLEILINTPINFDEFGEKGTVLLTRLLSHPNGFAKLMKENDQGVVDEIKKWDELFNYRYVKLLEEDISDSLTLHQRGADGKYDKRNSSSSSAYNQKELHIPPHLYGQLSRHNDGFKLLTEHGSIARFLKIIFDCICDSDVKILELKASIWSLAHFCSSNDGFELLQPENVVAQLIHLAETSPIYSIRATAYYALGLIGTTQLGADEIFRKGWVCTRHSSHENYPIIHEENYANSESENESEDSFLEYSFSGSGTGSPPPFSRLRGSKSFREDRYKFDSPERNSVYRKSSTLPINRNSSYVNHQRSMSESKTFEMLKNYELKLRERVGLSKQYSTRSTGSGDYSPNSKFQMFHTLSPIPSSSNVLAMTRRERKNRRHSESCRKDSECSCNSQRGNSQDFGGIMQMHYLRSCKYSFSETDDGGGTCGPSKSLPPFNQMNKVERNFSVDDYIFKSSLSSLHSSKKYSHQFHEKLKTNDGPCYMGIALPQHLNDLFPVKENSVLNTTTTWSETEAEMETESSQDTSLSVLDEKFEIMDFEREFVHNLENCIDCRVNSSNTDREEIKENSGISCKKAEILQYIELLSNPLWNKQSKLALLQLKQESPKLFEDTCLYSEACKIIAENNFRLNIRRIVHELFFDVCYSNVYKDAKEVLKKRYSCSNATFLSDEDSSIRVKSPEKLEDEQFDVCAGAASMSPNEESRTFSDPVAVANSSQINLTDISGLKLSYKDNKFPIKHRDM